MKTLSHLLVALFCCTSLTCFAGRGEHRQAFKEHFGAQRAKIKEHFQQQHAERKELHGTLKDMEQEERRQTIEKFANTQHQENLAFFSSLYAENRTFVSNQLDQMEKLEPADKAELLALMDEQHRENQDFRGERFADVLADISAVIADPDLSMEEKKTKVRAIREQAKTDTKAHHETQHGERKAMREQMREKYGRKKAE